MCLIFKSPPLFWQAEDFIFLKTHGFTRDYPQNMYLFFSTFIHGFHINCLILSILHNFLSQFTHHFCLFLISIPFLSKFVYCLKNNDHCHFLCICYNLHMIIFPIFRKFSPYFNKIKGEINNYEQT